MMGDFGNAIKYLYSQFILRDVLSFITPGAIVVFTAFLLFLPGSSLIQRLVTLFGYSTFIHWLLYIPLFGGFYMIGFAVQCFGELFGLIRTHVDAKACFRQRFRIFLCDWTSPDNIWWKKAHEDAVDFNEKMEDDKKEWARLQNERLVVLKQMCANGLLASVIAAVFILVKILVPNELNFVSSLIAVFIVALLLLASLFWGYRVHELRLYTMSKAIRHLPFGGKEGS